LEEDMKNSINKVIGLCIFIFTANAGAADYWKGTLMEFPDPTTIPKVTTSCVSNATANYPCPSWKYPGKTCTAKSCNGWATKTEALRVKVIFKASGPDSAEQAIKDTVTGYVAGCGALAMTSAKAAASATPSPEPTARIAAGWVAAEASFYGCITAFSASGVAGSIVKQVKLKMLKPTHWARL